MFETVAKYADGWAIGSWYLPSIDEYRQKLEQLKLHFLEVGREFESLKRAIGATCILAENKIKLNEKIKRFKPVEVTVEKYETTQNLLCGTIEECIESLEKYVDAGANYFILDFPDIITLETVRLFGEHVIPSFK